MIRSLFDAGVDMFRLNFSHGNHEDHKRRCEVIRDVERDVGRPIGIMVDLQGPKLRIGAFSDGPIELCSGDGFRLDLETVVPVVKLNPAILVMQSAQD
jgi:pyruvate kinase